MGRGYRTCSRCGVVKQGPKMATKLNSPEQYCKHCYSFVFKAQNIGV